MAGFVYVMFQYLKSFSLALLLSVGVGSVTSAESHNPTSTKFSRLVGVDIFGDDLTSTGIKGVNLAGCEAICAKDKSCTAYSFIEDQQWCFPKGGIGKQQSDTGVTSGIKSGHILLSFWVVETDSDSFYDRRSLVFVEEDGIKYLIEDGNKVFWYEEQIYKTIQETVDLDGDGFEEAILRTQQGGNCCGPIYYVIKRIEKGFYSILKHEEFSGWPSVDIEKKDKKISIIVKNLSEGADNTSMKETISELVLNDGQLQLLNKHENNAFIFAEHEVTSEELRQINNKELEYDFDLDGNKDILSCSYWERWGAVTSTLQSSILGEVLISGGCNRLGILTSVSNGMHDLVCNRSDVLTWDTTKVEYVYSEANF